MFFSIQICNCPSDFEDSRVGPGAQAEFVDGHLQKPLALAINGTEFLDVTIRHLAVTVNLLTLETAHLDRSGTVNPFLDHMGRLPWRFIDQVPVLD